MRGRTMSDGAPKWLDEPSQGHGCYKLSLPSLRRMRESTAVDVWGVLKVEMWLEGIWVGERERGWLAGGDGRIACTRSLSLVTNGNCQASEAERRRRDSE